MSSCKKYKLLKSIRNIFVISIVSLSLGTQMTQAGEREEIQAMVKELDYLIEVAVKMQKDYGSQRNQRVRFNYTALINQLKTTRQNTAAFFNERGESIQRNPPAVIDQDLYRISK